MAMSYMVNKDMTKERKTISISEDTHLKLSKLGTWGESMDDIINRLIARYNQK